MIKLRRIDHVCLRVADLDEASSRWAIQFGLSERERRGSRAYLACGYERYSLELWQEAEPGHDHTAFELARGQDLDAAARSLEARGVEHERRDGALHLEDPDGQGIEILPYRPDPDPRPAIARETSVLPGFRPRKLGHVNSLTGELEAMSAFYRDVLGMRLTDRLGDEGAWFHVNRDHHVVALVAKGYPHFHHLALEMTDWGELRVAFDHLAQHGRWLAWGPVRHGVGQNLCAYVRVPEEECLVEVFCDMEQLEEDHEPRDWPDTPHSSNTWGILPPRSYFRFDEAALEAERTGAQALAAPVEAAREP